MPLIQAPRRYVLLSNKITGKDDLWFFLRVGVLAASQYKDNY